MDNDDWDGMSTSVEEKWGESPLKQFWELRKIPSTTENEFKGTLIFYIDVGTMPPANADLFVHRVKDSIVTPRLQKHYELVFIPIRPNSNTRVEFIPSEKK